MSVVTEQVELMRRLPNGNAVRAGNQVQIGDADGDPIGVDGNPLVTSPDGTVGIPISMTTITPVISNTPDYIAGDAVGGVIEWINVVTSPGGRLIIDTVTVKDNAGQAPALTILLCSLTLNGVGGTYADNSPIVWGTGDKAKVVGVISIEAANYETVAGLSVQTLSGMEMAVRPDPSDTSLFVLVGAAGGYNAAATSDLSLTFYWKAAS